MCLVVPLKLKTQLKSFLLVMRKDGKPEGILCSGLEHEVRARAEAMMEITMMDVAPETNKELVRLA